MGGLTNNLKGLSGTELQTTGTSSQLLANDGAGGFTNVNVGSNLTYDTGTQTLSATGGSGSGSVTEVSVADANGFDAIVTNPTTTPEITLKTTITGIIKGDGTALQEAEAGTDYLTPTSTIDGGTF